MIEVWYSRSYWLRTDDIHEAIRYIKKRGHKCRVRAYNREFTGKSFLKMVDRE